MVAPGGGGIGTLPFPSLCRAPVPPPCPQPRETWTLERLFFPNPFREPKRTSIMSSLYPQLKVTFSRQDGLLCGGKFLWVSSLYSFCYNVSFFPLLLYSGAWG